MKENNNFCILHVIDGMQFLVDTTFNHDTDQYELTIKFWFEEINGFTSAVLKWEAEKEADFKNLFDKLHNIEYADRWLNGIKTKLTGE